MNVLILGGTGVISREITKHLLARGAQVSLFNRGSRSLPFESQVEIILGDKQDYAAFEAQMVGRKFDCVIDMISFDDKDAASTLRAFARTGAHFIFCSSSAAYARPTKSFPLKEDEETLTSDSVFPYALGKADLERFVTTKMADEKITILRPSLTFGPGCANVGCLRQNYNILDRIRRGKPLVMFGDGVTPWSFSFTPDVGQGFALAACNPNCYGKHYHIVNSEVSSWNGLYEAFARYCGKPLNLYHISAEMLMEADPSLFLHLYAEKAYFAVYDCAKFRADVPEWKPQCDLQKGIALVAEWFDSEVAFDPQKDALEDAICAVYEESCQRLRALRK